MSLREVGVSLIDCEHRTPPAAKNGYPYVGIPQLRDGRINLNSVRRIAREHFEEWTRKADPETFDVVLSRRCNPGETGHVPKGLKFALGQNLVLLRSDGKRVVKPFLRWLVRGPQWWEQVGKYINVGAVFDSLKCADIPDFHLRIPPPTEQHTIAHILGTLDDKIELNRRMNETLEAMSRALFKDWFVDFGPVRAKMEGRESNPLKRLADLFPDRLTESELGNIPTGWTVANIESLCVSISSGGTPARKNSAFWEGGTILWYKTGELRDGPLIDSNEYITEVALANSAAKLWPAGTILLALYAAPTVGRIGVLAKPGASNQAAAGLVAKPAYGTPFLRRVLIEARDSLQAISVGAAQQNINQRVLREHRLVVPNSEVAGTYSRLISPCDHRQVAIAEESRSLARVRDLILPKLISGEIRLRDAEKVVEAVA